MNDYSLLQASELFDANWYLTEYEDVALAGLDAVHHYLHFGASEGRRPGLLFDADYYCSQLSTPLGSHELPLLHYLRTGKAQGLKPTRQPRTVPQWYYRRSATQADGVRILYVLSVGSGGTPQTNQDLMHQLDSQQLASCLVLQCKDKVLQLSLFTDGCTLPLERAVLSQPVRALPHTSEEYNATVADWLKQYAISLVHIRHIAWHGLGLIHVARQQHIPVVFSCHDYYTVCPSVKLLDENLRYCAGKCTSSKGECSNELWPADQLTPLKHNAVHRWQQQFAKALSQCHLLITTSPYTKEMITGCYPQLSDIPFEVIEHGRDFDECSNLASAPVANEPLRILVPGFIARSKGANVLRELAATLPATEVQWHLLGDICAGSDLPGTVIEHGPYHRSGLAERVRAIRPHAGAVFSVWPETWCHTLTEMWAAGLPVLGFDIGAVGDRLRQSNAGWLVNELTASAVADKLPAIRQEWSQKHSAVLKWQQQQGLQQSCAAMAKQYWSQYCKLLI